MRLSPALQARHDRQLKKFNEWLYRHGYDRIELIGPYYLGVWSAKYYLTIKKPNYRWYNPFTWGRLYLGGIVFNLMEMHRPTVYTDYNDVARAFYPYDFCEVVLTAKLTTPPEYNFYQKKRLEYISPSSILKNASIH